MPHTEPAAARAAHQDLRDTVQNNRESVQDLRDITSALERVAALERWQIAQNGSLRRMEAKIDKLLYLLLGGAVTAIVAMAGVIATLLHLK
jgi:predicted lysophospholipase L1 biosynthesis ABC-type transport system permease subunit